MMKRLFILVVLIAGAVSLSGCGQGTSSSGVTPSGGATLKIVTTTGMIADIARNIGGKHVEVEALMGAGVDPHLYKATPGDIKKLNGAQIVFYNGLHLEGKMADILEKMARNKPSVAVAAGVPKSELHVFAAAPEFPDPHVWFDVKKWIIASQAVRDELVKQDAANRAEYESNARAYEKKLRELDNYARRQIALIPRDRRVLVTAHDAFGYFGEAYDIEVKGLQGISTATEASLQDVQRVVNLLVQRKIKAVFVESSVPRRTIEAVVQGVKAKGHNVVIGGELFSDAMGKSGTPEGTYDGMVRHNVDTIVKALK